MPQSWLARITSMEVGSYAGWHTLSDHCPLFIEMNLT
jgi:endonuclease/exonuclease/phosphatase family metal-dependent hydrolase